MDIWLKLVSKVHKSAQLDRCTHGKNNWFAFQYLYEQQSLSSFNHLFSSHNVSRSCSFPYSSSQFMSNCFRYLIFSFFSAVSTTVLPWEPSCDLFPFCCCFCLCPCLCNILLSSPVPGIDSELKLSGSSSFSRTLFFNIALFMQYSHA